jgi:hypothetical protein
MEIIATTVGEGQSATGIGELPPLDLLVNRPGQLEPVEAVDSEEEGENPLDEINEAGVFLCRWPNGDCSMVATITREMQSFSLMNGVPQSPACFIQSKDACLISALQNLEISS